MDRLGDVVALLVGHRTCDSQVVGSSPGWAPLHNGLGQAIYTCMSLSPNNIICYWPRGIDALLFDWEGNLGSVGTVTAAYDWVCD